MKVLFIYHDFPGLGGIETVTLLLANYFASQDTEVSIISAYSNPDCDYSIISPKIRLILTPEKRQLNSAVNIAFIEQYIKENQIQFVINQGCASEIEKEKLPKECKLIQVLHGLPFWEIKSIPYTVTRDHIYKASFADKLPTIKKLILNHIYPQRRYKRIFKRYHFFLNNADCYVTLSDGLGQIIKNKFPEYSNRIHAIENPTDPKIIDIKTKKEDEVIFAGRLNRSDKRVDRILHIWQQIEKRGTSWKLRIIGDGTDKERLLKIADKLNLKQCSFEGYHKDISKFLKRAKIIVLSSNFEGIPMSLIEGMQVGTIPVAYNCSPGMERLIDNHMSGILIPCFDRKAFSDELYTLMNNPHLTEQYSKAAILKTSEFEINTIGEKWIKLFNELKKQ